MFETFRDALNMIGLYAAVGFVLAVLYNILRFFRLMLPKMKIAAAVCDFLFAMTSGVVLFAYSGWDSSGCIMCLPLLLDLLSTW